MSSALTWAHPLVREWFASRFGSPTEPQFEGWPHILEGRDVLISAPTGSGKTLAAFLACLDRLVRAAVAGSLDERTTVVYVSPLKALGNDIQRNLDGPLAEIVATASARGVDLPPIRTAVRTGDTLGPARQAMLRRPPHILVTTPESLYIMLTAERSRRMLGSVSTVIVDEIHAVAGDKRGAHLALSLERLDALVGRPIPRVGLSATQRPIELVADFLTGPARRRPAIVQVAPRRTLDLAVEVPPSELAAVATHELWSEIEDRIATLVAEHRSTLVFVNTRRLAERVTHHLADRVGADTVAAHHGSLARRTRLDAERRLKAGDLKVLVATASLELGIDIGSIDLVCQIGSPRSLSAAVQRIGRAGHWRGAVPKGRLFPTTRDDLVECAALVLGLRRQDLDRLAVPHAPLDILSQQIVAMCACEDWREDDLFAVVTRAFPYRDLSRADFEELLEMLSGGITARRGRYGAYLSRDRVNGRVHGRRGSRLAAITGGGAIPDQGLYTVVGHTDGMVVGTVDEDFAVESMAGDVMLLGNTSWRIRRVSTGRVLVENAHGASPTIPFWRGEAPGRTHELSALVAEVRDHIGRLTPGARPEPSGRVASGTDAAVAWLTEACGLSGPGAEQAAAYVVAGRAVLGAVPTLTTVVAERFFDEGGGMQLVIHAPFGARINRAWGLALRKRFCRSFNFELQAAATDNGITIALAEQHSFPLTDVFQFLRPTTAPEVLEQAALASPLFGARWRWDAQRSLALLRFRAGRKVPIHLLRLQSDDLLASIFPDVAACPENLEGDLQVPDHPLVREVMKDLLTEAMDRDGFLRVLEGLADGTIRTVAVDTPVPSPFSHELLTANPYAFLDDAPLEERRTRAVEMRRALPESVLTEVGRLDPEAIAEVRRQAWPDVRDPNDLDDVLQTLVVLPASAAPAWAPLFGDLTAARRAGRARFPSGTFWMSTARQRTVRAVFPTASIDPMPELPGDAPQRSEALVQLVQGWMNHLGPVTIPTLAERVGLAADDVEAAMLRLEAAGSVLRGRFTDARDAPAEWCDRRLLARIHRLTLGRLRREVQPVAPADLMRWLLVWQHLAPGAQVSGERGLLEVLRQLQGIEAPASLWEPQILARRVLGYDPALLDRLCLTGVVGWGRLSRHPATVDASGHSRRVVPTSTAPMTFFVREEADWIPGPSPGAGADGLSRPAAAVLEHLRRAGASFFADITRATGHLKAEVETALWELVTAGLVTADGFDNLRALVDPRRRAGRGSGRSARPRHAAGRWSLVDAVPASTQTARLEALCRVLLTRYGVVFRELVAREANLPPWRELLFTLRRLEDRGEVRGGRFVDGFIGEQFALPIAVESLRAARRRPATGERVTLAAADPLNLSGVLLAGDRVPANSGRFLTLEDGHLVDVDTRPPALVTVA